MKTTNKDISDADFAEIRKIKHASPAPLMWKAWNSVNGRILNRWHIQSSAGHHFTVSDADNRHSDAGIIARAIVDFLNTTQPT